MANLIVCCDGTWNTADERDYGLPCPTNVAKIYNAVADLDCDGSAQKKYYHTGVGTEGSKLQQFWDGVFGDGLEKNIKSAYKWLCDTYRPSDKIFVFGFSRGAYTARYVAGMIASIGLADFSATPLAENEKWRRVDRVIEENRKDSGARTLPGFAFYNSSADKPQLGATPIEFLGVWDTVGALGIPSDLPILKSFDIVMAHQFRDTELSDKVLHARHAVAIDERRQNFTPTLWTNINAHQDAKQIWFVGVHSDVGGGYPQSGLSDIALDWMIKEAHACGLSLMENAIKQLDPNPRGVLHESCTGVFKPLKTLPRPVPRIVGGSKDFHESVPDRQSNWPIETSPYWPTKTLANAGAHVGPIDIFAQQHWNATGLFLEKGVAYAFQAEGEWIDGAIPCDPDGNQQDHKFHVHELIHLALDDAASLTEKLSNGLETNPWWGKRVEDAKWFALIGVIANGPGTDRDGNPVKHETFVIGKGTVHAPSESGYLYCFANDVWGAYANNRGSVRLTVTRR